MQKLIWMGCLSYLLIGMAHVVAGSVLEPMLDAYGMVYKDGGQWIMNQFLGFLVGVLGAPLVTRRIGRRNTLLLALASLTLAEAAYSLLLPWGWILTFAVLAGFGFGITEAVIGAMVIEYVEKGKAEAMTRLEVFFGLGALVMPAVSALLIEADAWRAAFPIVAVLSLVTTVLWRTLSFGQVDTLIGRAPQTATDNRAKPARYGPGMLPFLILGILFFVLYVGMEMSFSNYLPSMMSERTGMTPGAAATTMSIFWAAMSIGRLLSGRIADRIGYGRYLLISVLGGMILFVLIAMSTSAGLSLVYIAFGGLLWSGVFAIGLLYVNHWMPGLTERTTSLMVAAGGLGGAMLPRLMGWLMDRYGAQTALQVIAVSAMLMLLLLVLQVLFGRRLAHVHGVKETAKAESE